MNVIASEFVSLDGVMEAPETWSLDFWNDEHTAYGNNLLFTASGLLLGRVTYEGFAAAWPSRTGDFADRMNTLPKYVASSTIREPEWNNSGVMGGDVGRAVAALKTQTSGHLLVYGSARLVQSLLARDLIDEYHLWIFPLVLGKGKRLFDGEHRATLQLADVKSLGSGAVVLAYRR